MWKAQKILNELIKDLKEGNFKYAPKGEKKINWAAYNTAKINEIHFFITFIREAVDMAEVRDMETTGRGRPLKDAYTLAKVILLQIYFQVPERQASDLAMLFKEKLHLSSIPSARSIGRAYGRQDVQGILGRVFEMTHKPIAKEETSFSADGSGLPLSIKQNYANDRDDNDKHAGYDKMAIMISNNFHIATAFVHAKGTANDSPLFEPLIKATSLEFHSIRNVQLDAGFLSRHNCTLTAEVNAIPYIYPKDGITLNSVGSIAWRKMLESLIENPQEWLRAYHERSECECYFSAHKRRFAKPLLKRIKILRGVEAFCRIICLNICMLITAYFEQRVEVEQFSNT